MSCEDFDRALFNIVSASDYCDKVVDGTHDSPKEVLEGKPLVTSKHLKNGKILVENAYHISQDDFDAVNKRSKVDPFDIIFSMIGTIGEIAQVTPEYPEFAIKNVGLFKVSDKLKSDWLKYFLKSPQGKNEVELRKKGSTQQYVSLTDLRALPIPVPKNFEFRDRVLGVLQPIDNLIDSLRAQNAVLELIAQILFKSWFVNFDPVQAKAEGSDSQRFSPEIASLFPSELEESELGKIPKGWKVSTIGEFCEVIDCLHSKKPELLASGMPYLQLNCIDSNSTVLNTDRCSSISEKDYKKWTSRIEVTEGDCVVTNVGRVGAIAQIPYGFKGAIGRNMTAIRPKSHCYYPGFIIQALTSQAMKAEIEYNTDVGSILNALNVRSIPKLRFVSGPPPVLEAYEHLLKPIRKLIETNAYIQIALNQLSDELLPRLISGKIRIEEAEEVLVDVMPSTEKQVA